MMDRKFQKAQNERALLGEGRCRYEVKIKVQSL